MQVFKFGGASIKNASAIKNIVNIIQQQQDKQLLIVISAAGKTTNAMEGILQAYWERQLEVLQKRVQAVREQHEQIIQELFEEVPTTLQNEVHDIFIDLEWILEEEPQDTYDYLYDQIVGTGELLSTNIIAAYLQQQGVATTWLDVRDCLMTDNTYREAGVQWDATEEAIQQRVAPLLDKGLVITQGFLGATTENFTTTLGREGSDYTAAIFSYCLNAESMSIWKDVPGVLTADPRLFDNPTLLEQLSYKEAIEMTYYGAQVIHPKTIRPLQNKSIPLHVKSFIDPTGGGTTITDRTLQEYPSMLVVKKEQVLLRMISKDFYFVDEAKFARLFDALSRHRIKVNMTQNTALAFSVCVNQDQARIAALLEELAGQYDIKKIEGLKLVTIRHTTEALLEKMTEGRHLLLEERIGNTCQLLLEEQEVL
ncbi:MAG: aspartate kinase [Aureispira sp.]